MKKTVALLLMILLISSGFTTTSYTQSGIPITHALRADALCAKRYTLPGTPGMHALRADALCAKRYALSDEQFKAVQILMDDACRISGVPGMSMSVLTEGEVFYFSSGYADRENGLPASEHTLYELASVSKAFTGIGILLLEEQGHLSMDDSIQKYLPWFTLTYQGKTVDMQSLTLDNFLHHTSGLTNIRRTYRYL